MNTRKLTDAQIFEIIKILERSMTQAEIAKKYGVSQQTISLIKKKHFGEE